MHISEHSPFHGADSGDHGRVSVGHVSKLSRKKTCTHVSGSLVSSAKNGGDLRAGPTVLTPVPSQANHSCPPPRGRFQTVRLPRNLHACFDSLVGVSRHSRRETVIHVRLLGPCFATVPMKESTKHICCLPVWEPGTGGQDTSPTWGKAAFMAARVASLAWMLAMSQRGPTLVLSCSGSRRRPDGRELVVVVAQLFSDVTWRVCSGQVCSSKTASVLPACTICISMSGGPRSMLKATVNVVASFGLRCTDACLTPRRPHPI